MSLLEEMDRPEPHGTIPIVRRGRQHGGQAVGLKSLTHGHVGDEVVIEGPLERGNEDGGPQFVESSALALGIASPAFDGEVSDVLVGRERHHWAELQVKRAKPSRGPAQRGQPKDHIGLADVDGRHQRDVGGDLVERGVATGAAKAVDLVGRGRSEQEDYAESHSGHRPRLASHAPPPVMSHHGPMKTDAYRVKPGTTVVLPDIASDDTDGFDGNKAEAVQRTTEMSEKLFDLQQVLFADNSRKVLIVLQGMDTSGKDGTIKHVFKMVNPLGVKVANFKRPNDVELAHDYLWRVHHNAPANGDITIFNRSHYEDVLIVRVHDLVPKRVWSKRYNHIRNFEQMLADEGTVIRKFFLHISKETQRERLQERLDNPAKHWKFEHGDIAERKHWDAYTEAYGDALSETSTKGAPWYVIPSDRKWYRNLLISTILVETLQGLELSYPEPAAGLDQITIDG